MNEKIFDELQKLYDNERIGALVQEICEYYATKGNYEDGSYENEIEPPQIVESAYTIFCLQSREQILDEFALVRKKYPTIYQSVSAFHSTLLVNMDYKGLEEKCALLISEHLSGISADEVLSQAETYARSSKNLSEALDRFYKWLHLENH